MNFNILPVSSQITMGLALLAAFTVLLLFAKLIKGKFGWAVLLSPAVLILGLMLFAQLGLLNSPPVKSVAVPAHTAKTSQSSALTGSCFDLARSAAKSVGIDATLYARQINQESGCQASVCSSAGACGAAQLMPATAAALGVNPLDVSASLNAGARLMSAYLRAHGGSWQIALACYNAGSGRVGQALSDYGDNWLYHMPLETQDYIKAILG